MKKVFYDSKVAKAILFDGYSTITLLAWVFTKYKTLMQETINHECTHARQWIELTVAGGLFIWLGMLVFDYSAWYLAISPIVFYLWYGLEYCIRRIMGLFVSGDNKQHTAYREVSFEQEARLAEKDNNYLENSHYYAWMKFIIKTRK